ncbi:hypothetical protein Plhal304r1_c019g0069871 [Plasmopara halstedii]
MSAIASHSQLRCTTTFWQSKPKILGTRLDISTADHLETDDRTERANCDQKSLQVFSPRNCSKIFPLIGIALGSTVHVLTGS